MPDRVPVHFATPRPPPGAGRIRGPQMFPYKSEQSGRLGPQQYPGCPRAAGSLRLRVGAVAGSSGGARNVNEVGRVPGRSRDASASTSFSTSVGSPSGARLENSPGRPFPYPALNMTGRVPAPIRADHSIGGDAMGRHGAHLCWRSPREPPNHWRARLQRADRDPVLPWRPSHKSERGGVLRRRT